MRLPVFYARSYLYGIIAVSLAYQIMLPSFAWLMVTLAGFATISLVGIGIMDYDTKHKAIGLANVLLLWQIFAVFIPSVFITNPAKLDTVAHAPYAHSDLNLQRIPSAKLQNLINSVGVNTYGGELVSREIIQQHYKIPMYLYPALVQQAHYTNTLQKLGIINGVPLNMANFKLPSVTVVQKTERTSAGEYMDMAGSPQTAREALKQETYADSVRWLNRLNNRNYLLPNLTIKQIQAFNTVLKQYNVRISIPDMFTYYLGTQSLVNLYKQDMLSESKATECQRTLGYNNPECGKVAGVVTYFTEHDNYHKPR